MRSLAFLVAFVTVAHAQPSLTPPCPPSEPQLMPPASTPPVDDVIPGEDWYGHQTLLVDAGAIAVLAVGSISEDTRAAGAVGVLLWAFGTPTVHLFHGRRARA